MLKTCLAFAAVLALALIVLILRPGLDVDVARLFLDRPGHFIGDTPGGIALRYTLWALPFVLLAVLLLASARPGVPRLGPGSLLFLLLSLYAGPGLTVHATLKEVSHRPRPRALSEFGGANAFRPWSRFDGACRHDCSFPSGETALAAWTLAPASLAPQPWRGAAVAAAFAFAVLTGGWRMALGAHFLSDVCAASLISILVVLACRPLALSKTPTPP